MISDSTEKANKKLTEYQKQLASHDGVFCEPACAVSIAGVVKENKVNPFREDEVIVSIITGHGLKDPNQAIKISTQPELVENTEEAILDKIHTFME